MSESDTLKTTKLTLPFWLGGATCIATIGLLVVVWLLQQFDAYAATLSPGTRIRPMIVSAYLVITGLGSITVGGFCALIAVFKSVRNDHSRLTIVSLVSLVLTWAPLIVGVWGFGYLKDHYKLELAN